MAQKSRKNLKVADVISLLEGHAPSETAESWDNVGLLVGDPSWTTSGAVVSIDLTEDAILAAKQKGYRLIVNHHPCIFPRSKGIARVTAGAGKSGLIFDAIREGIAVAAYHTNFDRCALEVARQISAELGLKPMGRLFEKGGDGSLVKLVVFVPQSHLEIVREAVTVAGAGQIGNYDSCTFASNGTGTFRGQEGSDPFIGKPGQLEQASEVKLEVLVPRGLERKVLRALRQAHPYEEVAYDLMAVEQRPQPKGLVAGLGYGFWGEFARPRPLSTVLKAVGKIFDVEGALLTGDAKASAPISRVAFAAGKGASVVNAASALGCDLMITGEAGYHDALEGSRGRSGMRVLELGHTESERFFMTTVEGWLKSAGLKASSLYSRAQYFTKV